MFEEMKFRIDYLIGRLPENLAYGHQITLERYCGKKLRIFGRLQHGYPFKLENNYANAQIADSEYPNFYWRKSDAELGIERSGSDQHFFVGSPYIYLQEHAPSTFLDLPKKFSLDILPHSHYWDPPGFVPKPGGLMPIPIESIIEEIENVSRFEPVFLIYRRDVVPQVVNAIEKCGYKWFTLGDGLYSEESQATFLGTLRNLLREAEEVIFHCTISAMAYAALENKPIYFSSIRAGDTQVIPWSGYLENDFYIDAQSGLGVKDRLSPDDLASILQGERILQNMVFVRRYEFLKKSSKRALGRLGILNQQGWSVDCFMRHQYQEADNHKPFRAKILDRFGLLVQNDRWYLALIHKVMY